MSVNIPEYQFMTNDEVSIKTHINSTTSMLGVLVSGFCEYDSYGTIKDIYNFQVCRENQVNTTLVSHWDIALLYETEYREDELLIQKDNKWYGVWSYKFRQAYLAMWNSHSTTKNYNIYMYGYPYGNSPTDLEKSIQNDSYIVCITTKDLDLTPFQNTTCFDNPNEDPAIVSAWNNFKIMEWNSFVCPYEITYDYIMTTNPTLMYSSTNYYGYEARKYYIDYCNTMQERFLKMITSLNYFFNSLVYYSEVFQLSGNNYRRIYECFRSRGDTNIDIKYIVSGSSNYYRVVVFKEDDCYIGILEYLLYKTFELNWNHVKTRLFNKATNTLLLTNNILNNDSNSVYTNDLSIDYPFINQRSLSIVIKQFINRDSFYTSKTPHNMACNPDIVRFTDDNKLYYPPYNVSKELINELYIRHHNVTIELFQIQNIQEVLSEAEKYNDSDDLIFFGPDFRRKIKFKSIGYNAIPTENDSFGNVYIRYKFYDQEGDYNYMRTKGWNFILEDETIIPWYFVRSSDYNDWINKFNENRNATTPYRRTESGSDTTIYFKDSETGMTGAIEASNYFKTLFENTSYLQNDDLDGIGEICSSILAIEKEFYEALNDSSESTADFKSYNTYYIGLLENRVDELHLLITEQEEMINDVKTKFSEILDLIYTFYAGELPIPKEPVDPEDILDSQISVFDQKNVLSIFN